MMWKSGIIWFYLQFVVWFSQYHLFVKISSKIFKMKFILFIYSLAALHGTWDLSAPTRDWTHAPALEGQSFNHWTTREVHLQTPKQMLTLFFIFLSIMVHHRILDIIPSTIQ